MFKWLKNVFNNDEDKNKEDLKDEKLEAGKEDLPDDQEQESEVADEAKEQEKEEALEEKIKDEIDQDTKKDLEKIEKVEIDEPEEKEKLLEEKIKDEIDQGTEKDLEKVEKAEINEEVKTNIADISENQTVSAKEDNAKENIQKTGQDVKETTANEVETEEIKKNDEIKEVETQEVKKEEEPVSFFKRLKTGLLKTRNEMGVKINTMLGQYVKIEDDLLEDLEDVLISADVGMETTMKLVDNLRETIIQNKINDPDKVVPLLKEEIKKLMDPNLDTRLKQDSPLIILVIGVNGVGKTTTIGKLSSRLKSEGKKVLVAAADTFRAAAIDQLKTWGTRSGVDVIAHSEGADPAAVIFDAIAAAKSRKADVLICDTAGRLHNKANLMKELEKINKVISKEYPEAARETLLVLDATTGQNAIVQAKTFKEACEPTGIALTKLDGTAKGGVVIALQSELKLPIKLIGVGEQIEDLQDFNMDNFIDAIFD